MTTTAMGVSDLGAQTTDPLSMYLHFFPDCAASWLKSTVKNQDIGYLIVVTSDTKETNLIRDWNTDHVGSHRVIEFSNPEERYRQQFVYTDNGWRIDDD